MPCSEEASRNRSAAVSAEPVGPRHQRRHGRDAVDATAVFFEPEVRRLVAPFVGDECLEEPAQPCHLRRCRRRRGWPRWFRCRLRPSSRRRHPSRGSRRHSARKRLSANTLKHIHNRISASLSAVHTCANCFHNRQSMGLARRAGATLWNRSGGVLDVLAGVFRRAQCGAALVTAIHRHPAVEECSMNRVLPALLLLGAARVGDGRRWFQALHIQGLHGVSPRRKRPDRHLVWVRPR